jgi:hypothetical protein
VDHEVAVECERFVDRKPAHQFEAHEVDERWSSGREQRRHRSGMRSLIYPSHRYRSQKPIVEVANSAAAETTVDQGGRLDDDVVVRDQIA